MTVDVSLMSLHAVDFHLCIQHNASKAAGFICSSGYLLLCVEHLNVVRDWMVKMYNDSQLGIAVL